MSLINQAEQQISIYIENVVATATLNCTLNLEKIVKKIPNTKYNPKKFPGGIFRLESPKVVILFFRTGKIVCTGGTSIEMTKKSLVKFTNILEKCTEKIITLKFKNTEHSILCQFWQSCSSRTSRKDITKKFVRTRAVSRNNT